MAIYINQRPGSFITSIEFSPDANGHTAFIHLRGFADEAAVKQLLSSPQIDESLIASARMDDHPVLIVCGGKTKDTLLHELAAHGEKFMPPQPKHAFHPWVWRGNMSFAGQGLTLASGAMKKGGLDGPKLAFAGLNIAANFVNLIFGAQKAEDTNQLRYLKEQFNEKFAPYVQEGMALPSPDEKRAALRKDVENPSLGERAYAFMKRNSVRVGEIGLRYFGSIALAFPVTKWGASYTELKKGSFAGAFKAARNANNTNFYTGVAYLAGKSIGMFSKVSDPYDPKPHTTLDAIREKVLFRLSSVIETGAAGMLAYGGFAKEKITLPQGKLVPASLRGTSQRDVLGGMGGAFLTGGLITRFFAKFGKKELNMDELYAHITDSLARLPQEELPGLVAQTAADLKSHLKESPLPYGEIYTRIANDLYRYHHIALPSSSASALSGLATPRREMHAAAHPDKMSARIKAAARTHAERIAKEDRSTALSA